jgi:hypothetical protein
VKWALAALRDVTTLPDQLRGGPGGGGPGGRGGIYDRPDENPDSNPGNRDG